MTIADPGVGTYFDEHWPGIAADLARWLPAKGVPRQDVADLVQETAVRLLRRWPELDRSEPLGGLARVVALNLWRDRVKAAARREVCVERLPELPVEHVEREVAARADLRTVVTGFADLPAAQQSVLRTALSASLAGVTDRVPRSAAYRMLLMRARKALAVKLNGLAVAVWWRRRGPSPDAAGSATAVVVAFVLAVPGGSVATGADVPPALYTRAPTAASGPRRDPGGPATERATPTPTRAPAGAGLLAAGVPPPRQTDGSFFPLDPPAERGYDPPVVEPSRVVEEPLDQAVCGASVESALCE